MANAWIAAARLRTLPLAASSIIAGNGIAYAHGKLSWQIGILTILTAILLQILSNFANDYGDFTKGTDNADRVGPQRALQSGSISASQMKRALITTSLITLVVGCVLVWRATIGMDLLYPIIFILLGIAAIAAAIKYTVGRNPYGYAGLGDLFVFIFFGGVGVMGSYWLQTKQLDMSLILPASAFGMLAAGVLNLNNMRDIENDGKMGKRTIPVKIGLRAAKMYEWLLLVGAMVFLGMFGYLNQLRVPHLMVMLAPSPLLLIVLMRVYKTQDPGRLDPLLKMVGIATLLMACSLAGALVTAAGSTA